MNSWQQKLREEISLYQNNLEKFNSFDSCAFLKEYGELREKMQKNLLECSKKHYELMHNSYSLHIADNEQKSVAKEERTKINKKLKEEKETLKELLDSQANCKARIDSVRTTLNESRWKAEQLGKFVPKGGFLNIFLGDFKEDKSKELNDKIAQCEREINELQASMISDERKSEMESTIQTLEKEVKELTKNITALQKSANKNLDDVSSYFNAFNREIEQIYNDSVEQLKSSILYNEYLQLLEKINLRRKSTYITTNYSVLSPLVYLCSIGFLQGELSDKYSAPCRELFSNINNSLTDSDVICQEISKEVATVLEFSNDIEKIKNDAIYEIFGIKLTEEDDAEKLTEITDQNFYNALLFSTKVDKISADAIQDELKFSINSPAYAIIYEMQFANLIAKSNKKEYTINKKDLKTLLGNTVIKALENSNLPYTISGNIPKQLASNVVLEAKKFLELQSNECTGVSINPDFLSKIISTLDKTDGELPEIAAELNKNTLSLQEEYTSMLSRFKDLYYATPEQVAIANNEYYAQKKIEQIKENAELERKAFEEQAKLDRIAENERAYLLAQAEYRKAEAIEQQTKEMARQAELDRIAENERSQQEVAALNSIEAWNKCNHCKFKNTCRKKGKTNCTSYQPDIISNNWLTR